ncbi:hypothetical protein [Lacisediminihabitans changchengi]|uniref:Uncharacterized protein n=1 Tax=Lacisediminihabitans changchengi TaxID=2787634 RepID=A0A934SL69_9MICO|nr:hypothetical protein [Lacisediminihabitans changchengi]MBK4348651.1 hypothetical protein [Lacisediminihabitans changchengi]
MACWPGLARSRWFTFSVVALGSALIAALTEPALVSASLRSDVTIATFERGVIGLSAYLGAGVLIIAIPLLFITATLGVCCLLRRPTDG